tara:strand:+ start:158 stop:340 length:183 start_codon:yes stop_codon:yes gene_type:complete
MQEIENRIKEEYKLFNIRSMNLIYNGTIIDSGALRDLFSRDFVEEQHLFISGFKLIHKGG